MNNNRPPVTDMPPLHQNPFFAGRAQQHGAPQPGRTGLVEKDFVRPAPRPVGASAPSASSSTPASALTTRALPSTPPAPIASSNPRPQVSTAAAPQQRPLSSSVSFIQRSPTATGGCAAQAPVAGAAVPSSSSAGAGSRGGSQIQRPGGVSFGPSSFAPATTPPSSTVSTSTPGSRPLPAAGPAAPTRTTSARAATASSVQLPASAMGSSITRSTGTRPSGAAPQRPVSAAYTQAAITKSLAADASSRAVARMSRAGSQVHRAAAITELGALNTQELAAEERLAGLWGRPVGSPCNALERAIGARFNSDGEVDKFVKGMIRIQRLAAPYRKKVKNIHYRRNVAREILKTEEFYVESLDVLLCTFLEPLMKLAALKKEQLPQITNLVSNLVIIRNFNKTLLQDMRPRLEAWSESQCIGDIFVSTSMYLKSYTVYVSIYNGATTELVDCCKRNVEIDSFLTAQSEQASRQSIYAYLIQPVQRIPRYRMLLADLLKHTGPTHKDHANLEKATNLVGDVASIVNSKAAEAERIAKVIEIQNRLIGCAVGLVSPSRRFVESSLVLVWNNNMKPDQAERRVIFLFNDLIVEAKPSKKGGEEDKVKFIQDYHLTRLHPVISDEESRSDHHYGIFLLMEGGEPLLKLFFKEKVERDKIKEELKKVLDELKVNRQKYEELVDKRARERAEKTKEMFDARYNLNSSSSETEPTPAAEGGKDNKWEARLKAMKERQAALRQQPEETPQTKSRSLSTGLPPAKEALGVPQQPAGPAGGRSATVASARYSLPPTLMPPQPSPVSEKLSSSGGGVATKSPQKKKGNISRLSAFFGGSSAKKMNKDKDATA